MKNRVRTNEVSRHMSEVMQMAGLMVPNRLHMVVAERTGLHPTTIMRYHLGRLESADPRVLACMLQLKEELERGEQPFEDPLGTCSREDAGTDGLCWHSGPAARAWFDRVLAFMQDPPPVVLYRHLAKHLDLDVDTVAHFHEGGSRAVPVAVVRALRELYKDMRSGEPIVFEWGGKDVVLTRHVAELIETIAGLRVLGNGVSLYANIQAITGIEAGDLASMASGATGPLVEARILYLLCALHGWLHYDPTRHYEVGDVLFMDDLGAGRVVGKCHKEKILVEFPGGIRRLLREDIHLDPLLAYRYGSA